MLTIEVLGPLAVRADGRLIKIPKKAGALLAYLAVQGKDAIVPRYRLADLLWPYQYSDKARHSLRNCLMELRKAAHPHHAFFADYNSVKISPDVQSDITALLKHAGSENIAELRQCCALYRGDFLAELELPSEPWEEWVEQEHYRLQTLYSEALFRLSKLSSKAGDHHSAIRTARQLFDLDHLVEAGHRLLMHVLNAAHRGAEAVRFYAQAEEILRRELGITPAWETQKLLALIRSKMLDGTARAITPILDSGEIAMLRAQIENVSGENAALKSGIAELAVALVDLGERVQSMVCHKPEGEMKPAA